MVKFEVQLEGNWAPVSGDYATSLLREFASGNSVARIENNGFLYEVNLRELVQKNVQSGKERALRVTGEPATTSAAPEDQIIHVNVKNGRDLRNTEVVGHADPYCIAQLDGVESQRTGVVKNGGSDPDWEGNGGCLKLKWNGERVLRLKVMDENTGSIKEGLKSKDDFVGECHVNVSALVQRGGYEGWLTLYRDCTEPFGELLVQIRCQHIPEASNTAAEHRLLQVTPAKQYRNRAAGILHVFEGDKIAQFKTYAMALQQTPDVFGDASNANYDDKHAVIFEDSPQGAALRTTFKAEHVALFRTKPAPHDMFRSDVHLKFFQMSEAGEFMKMIKGGVRHGRRRVFTYSIIDQGMFFAETGMSPGKDNFTKHVVHSGGARSVRYAGTFRICADDDGRPVMVFDNDSGTYRPSKDHLPLAEEVLRRNLPGLSIKGLSVLDPQPEEMKVLIGPNENKDDDDAVYPGTWVWRR